MSIHEKRYAIVVGRSFHVVRNIVEMDFGWVRYSGREQVRPGGWTMENGIVRYCDGVREMYGLPPSFIYLTTGWQQNRNNHELVAFANSRAHTLINAISFINDSLEQARRNERQILMDTLYGDFSLHPRPTEIF